MINIEITNYESIENIKFSIDGFTALIGRNHIGKSAILRAINAALTNKEGTEFIRWNEKFCEVKIEIKDKNFCLLWHKEKNNSYYNINGKIYKKIGKSDVPNEIYEIGFKPVLVGDQKIDINYSPQFSPLFLIDKIGTKTTDLLTSVFELDKIYKAISLCNTEQKNNSDLIKMREKDLKILEESIKPFENFPEILKEGEKLKKDKENIEKIELEVKKLRNYKENIEKISRSLKKLSLIKKIEIPKLTTISKNIESYKIIKKQYQNLKQNTLLLKKLEPILKLDTCSETKKLLLSKKEEYFKIKGFFSKLTKSAIELKKLEKIKTIELPKSKINIKEFQKIKELNNKVNNLKEELTYLEKNIKIVKEEIDSIKKELNKFNVCPFCGNTLKEK